MLAEGYVVYRSPEPGGDGKRYEDRNWMLKAEEIGFRVMDMQAGKVEDGVIRVYFTQGQGA